MLVEGIDVYLMLVKVFDTGRSMVTYFYVIGYGGPAVIVVLSVIIVEASGTHGYGTPDQWVIHNTGCDTFGPKTIWSPDIWSPTIGPQSIGPSGQTVPN